MTDDTTLRIDRSMAAPVGPVLPALQGLRGVARRKSQSAKRGIKHQGLMAGANGQESTRVEEQCTP